MDWTTGKTYIAIFSAMFFGFISYSGVGTLTVSKGNFNSEGYYYINILDEKLVACDIWTISPSFVLTVRSVEDRKSYSYVIMP